MRHLQIKHTNPLEREFEAWVISGIESYLESLGIAYSVFAVSPSLEKVWPADERVVANGKAFGLQFKQAKLSDSAQPLPAQLHWAFHQPPGQFSQVMGSPEVYYCLPTFVNREFRKQALHHCLFWRPNPKRINLNAWYGNYKARTPYKELATAPRWGLFIEEVLNCNVGRRIRSNHELTSYVAELKQRPFSDIDRASADPADSDSTTDEGLYVVALSLES